MPVLRAFWAAGCSRCQDVAPDFVALGNWMMHLV
jgi:hypothetical protein